MTRVTVLVGVLGRPHRVEPFLASLEASKPAHAHRVDPLFLVSPGDHMELAAIEQAGTRHVVVPWEPGHGDYAKKTNLGFRMMHAEGYDWMLQVGDDVEFRPYWLERALAAHRRTGACVVGTNDTVNSRVVAGRHATHSLIHRDYLECGTIDQRGKVFTEEYGHWFVDDEFVQTAMSRGTWVFARDAVIAHLHPLYGKAVDDETYRKGQATVHADKALFESRQHLWNPAMARPR